MCSRYALAAIFLLSGFARRSSILGMVLQNVANGWCGSDRFRRQASHDVGFTFPSIIWAHPCLRQRWFFYGYCSPFAYTRLHCWCHSSTGRLSQSFQRELNCSEGLRKKQCRIACSNLWFIECGCQLQSDQAVLCLILATREMALRKHDRHSHSRGFSEAFLEVIFFHCFINLGCTAGSDVVFSKGHVKNSWEKLNKFIF